MPTVHDAITRAEALLPGVAAAQGMSDPRWQAMIEIAEFIEAEPEVSSPRPFGTSFRAGGRHEQGDVRRAVACCLLEHVLEHHFDRIFARVETEAIRDSLFADTFLTCWTFGQAEQLGNAERFERLRRRLSLFGFRMVRSADPTS